MTYPIETQIDIYLCGTTREPPDAELAYLIAEGGERNIPYIAERLKVEEGEYAQDNLIFVFEILSEKGHLHARQDLIDLISRKISGMKNSTRKEVSLERLRKIERNANR